MRLRRAGIGQEGRRALKRQEKEGVVAELHDKLERSKAAILTDYRGLNGTEITELRQQLSDEGVEYRVIKNTLTRLAVKDTDASQLEGYLLGPNALALSYDDELKPARLLLDYAKKNEKLMPRDPAGEAETRLRV